MIYYRSYRQSGMDCCNTDRRRQTQLSKGEAYYNYNDINKRAADKNSAALSSYINNAQNAESTNKSEVGPATRPTREANSIVNNIVPPNSANVKCESNDCVNYLDDAIDNIARSFFYSSRYGRGVRGKSGYEWRMFTADDTDAWTIAEMLISGKYVIGAVPEDNGKTRFAAFDFDGTDALYKAKKLINVFNDKGIPFFISHSGKKGYHIFISFDEYESVESTIAFEKNMLSKAGLYATTGKNTHAKRAVEIRPFGNGMSIIKLPMSLHLDGVHHEMLLDSNTLEPLTTEQTIDFFANVLPYKQTALSDEYSQIPIISTHTQKSDQYKRYISTKKTNKQIHRTTASVPASKRFAFVDKAVVSAVMHDVYNSFVSKASAEQMLAWLQQTADSTYVFEDIRQIAYDPYSMIDLFRIHDIDVPTTPGKAFRCPFHKDNHPSASIMPSRDSGIVHFNDWHGKGKKLSYNISDIHASLQCGKLVAVTDNKEMFRNLILAAFETGRVTVNAKRVATNMLTAYDELKARKGAKKILTNSLKAMVLVTLQAYTGGLLMLSSRYFAKIIGEKHSAATKLLKYLAVIGILRVSQANVNDKKADVYMANPVFTKGTVVSKLKKLAKYGATNISRLTQEIVAHIFGFKYACGIYYRITTSMEEMLAEAGEIVFSIKKAFGGNRKGTVHPASDVYTVPVLSELIGLVSRIVGPPGLKHVNAVRSAFS